MIRRLPLVTGAALIGLVVAVLAFHVDLTLVATIAMATVCLAWLVAIVVLPWNLYFRAHHLLAEMATSQRRGIAVDDEARVATSKIARRMLLLSIGLHVVSAALLGASAALLDIQLGYAFAALFLLGTLFRPAVEYYRYLHRKLADYRSEVLYPRDDVITLVEDVRRTAELATAHSADLVQLGRDVAALGDAMRDGDRENGRKLDAVARKFEETLDRLTDNQEIISGIKAFLRLVQPAR